MTADQIRSLQPDLAALLECFRGCFVRASTFRHWQRYLLGLLADLKRKSIEPIALAAGMPVRTLQEFLSVFEWDHERVNKLLQQRVMDRHASETAIGVIDASGHAKQGTKTPGVQRQWCGETGKVDNCVVGQHLLYTDNDPRNPFTCLLASDLYLPKSWAHDRQRCRERAFPTSLVYRPKWRIAVDQVDGGDRQRCAVQLDHIRRGIWQRAGVLVRVGLPRPAGHRRGAGQLPVLAEPAALLFAAAGPCRQAGGQRVPVQPGVPRSGVAPDHRQGDHPRAGGVGTEGRPGAPGGHVRRGVQAHGPANTG